MKKPSLRALLLSPGHMTHGVETALKSIAILPVAGFFLSMILRCPPWQARA